MKPFFFLTALLSTASLFGQENTEPAPLTFSGYIETYYSYDFANPNSHRRPGIFYSHNRHNEFNLNLGYLKAAYAKDRVRGNLALMAGTYAQYNLAAELPVMQHIFEANAGVKLSKENNLWLDMGILPSHIGFEGAVGKDCWTLTRSLIAETSPYYESGARLSYTSPDGKWYAAGLLLNGWQRIARVDGNQALSVGTQLTYKPNDRNTLNWSTFVGSDYADFSGKTRIFNDFYGVFQLGERFGLTAGCDIGLQQTARGSGEYDAWLVPILIARLSLNDYLALAGRLEIYNDPNEVIIATSTPNGFQARGFSVNLDWSPVSNAVLRLETRQLYSRDAVFFWDGDLSHSNVSVTAAAAVSF